MNLMGDVILMVGKILMVPAIMLQIGAANMKQLAYDRFPDLKGHEIVSISQPSWHSFSVIRLDIKDGPEPGPNLIVLEKKKDYYMTMDFGLLVSIAKDCKILPTFEDFFKKQANDYFAFVGRYNTGLSEKELLVGLAKYAYLNSTIVEKMEDVMHYRWNAKAMSKISELLKQDRYGSECVVIQGYQYGLVAVYFDRTDNRILKVSKVVKLSGTP